MPIYSNIASTLARQGPRTLAYGYAQSFIAVTHPQVYASQNRPGLSRYRTNKIGLLSSYQFQNVFHNGTQNTNSNTHVRNEKCDGGLDAYFEAWRKTHAAGEPEKEWTQFQFAKRIEWKPGSVGVENEVVNTVQTEKSGEEHHIEHSDINIIESISQNGNQIDEVTALADINTADNKIETKTGDSTFQTQSNLNTSQSTYPTPQIQEKCTNSNTNELSHPSSPNSAYDLQSRKYENHLIRLSKDQKYVEIPAAFEAMLVAGVNPTVTAYNTLIDSALQISSDKSNATSKVLEIYSDMRRRNILPDSTTYQKILTIVASRTLEVNQLKKQLEEKRVRFGGIDFEGKFMLNSSEIKYATLVKDDNVDILTEIYDALIASNSDHNYSTEMYHQLITAYSTSGRRNQMTKIFEHMKAGNVIPMASTFCQMINCVSKCGELDKAVDYYNIYKNLAIDHDNGTINILHRQDSLVYASLIKAYVVSDRMSGALKFYNKIIEVYAGSSIPFSELIVHEGFVKGLIESGMLSEALKWAENLTGALRYSAMTNITTVAADLGIRSIADTAFEHLLQNPQADIITPTISMLALSVREGRVQTAEYYWGILSHPMNNVNSSFIEPTAMFAVAMIGSGKIFEGLISSENMYDRIRKSAVDKTGHLYDEINEGITFINNFMSERGIFDPRLNMPENNISTQTFALPSHTTSMYEDSFDPYASKTDYKGSSIISDELDRASSRGRGGKLSDIVSRFKNMRSTGRHPRYAIYAKLISAAAREKKMDLVHEILEMARIDVPLLQQYRCVRYGWISILDAMIGACLTLGDRNLAAQYHQELLSIGAVPTANTFGLYITTLKGCTKTFDEAADAIKIFNQAKSEGVKPSSFLYNALIGKLGKARRIDDCLHYFSEMRYLGIRPTSVTYGTIVNALCRVSDENLAEFLFEEMESMPNYKPRPAPYNSLMQFFLNTKRDKSKVLSYFERMMKKGIKPTSHTYKLIVDAHATLDPINMAAAEAVLDIIRRTGQEPEAVHYSSLIHAKGCVMHDIDGAKAIFESVMADPSISPQACLYQALFEAMVSNHLVHETEPILKEMPLRGVGMTPYIANTLIHGWTSEKNIHKAESIYSLVNPDEREPSTYDAMIRAYLIVENRLGANTVVKEMLSRNYPSAVSSKICELLGINHADNCN